jgi:hypothetical protein
MIKGSLVRLATAVIVATLIVASGCDRDPNLLEPAPFPEDAEVFLDAFGPGLTFQAFGGSKLDALGIDLAVKYRGSRSLKFTVPSVNDPTGAFAGGAFVTSVARNLSGYDALTFWARASVAATIGVVGFGNNNTGTSVYVAEMKNLAVTTAWQKYIVPIPNPGKLKQEDGLFQLAVGAENGSGFEIWFDEVKFEKLGTIAFPRPAINGNTVTAMGGDTFQIGGTRVTFDVGGANRTVEASPGYFTFSSSDNTVATVNERGVITAVGLGTAEITARLGSVDAAGKVTVNVVETPPGPAVAAPTPAVASSDVISLFSNAYANAPVDTWSAVWDVADVEDIQLAGNDTKRYTNLVFAGIEFVAQPIDASTMTHFHLDFWTPDATAAPAVFRIKLVDFGADGAFAGGDDVEHELTFDATTVPALASQQWISFDLPLSSFTGLVTKGHLAQLIISGDPKTVYVDNVYFYAGQGGGGGGAAEPSTAAPTPTVAASDVISLFSNAYANAPVDTWSAVWDVADVEDIQLAGNDTKRYTNLVFAGIEFVAQPIDASTMTHFHLDFWTPDATAAPAVFRIKLVDFGADGAFAGGDDVEHELTFDATTVPALASQQWISFDLPLSSFTGLVTKGHLAQLIFSGDLDTIYVDNVLLHK